VALFILNSLELFMKIVTKVLLLFSMVSMGYSQSTPGTVGFQFLKTHVAARAAGMGGAFLAISNDVNSIYYNPAGIATISKRTSTFTYLDDLLDFNTGFVGVVQPNVGPGNLGVAVLFKDYGTFKRTDITGQEIGDFNSNAVSIAGAYGMNVYPNLYVGASAKYLRFSIDAYSSDAIALDGGVSYIIPAQKLTFAIGFFNLGQATSAFVNTKDDLPANFKVGFSKQLAHLPLFVSFNAYKYSDENWHGALGGEFSLSPNVFLRVGYDEFGKALRVDSGNDTFAGAAVGLGLLWSNLYVDYSFSNYGELGSLNRFTITGQF
jgi:hypothetical protein